MKNLSRLKENRWFRVLVLLLVLIVPPIPIIALGWQPLAGSPQGIFALATILGSYALFFGALGALANATGFSLRDWLEQGKPKRSQSSVTSIGDGTQILQGTGDNFQATYVFKDSTVNLTPSTSAPLPSLSPAPPPPLSTANAPIFLPSTPSTPHALSAPPGDFTGRKSEIKTLKKQLSGGTRVAISGLAGMGGVGKTVLALYVANELKPQYPDAQIMLELKGTSHEPLASTEAMTQVIHTFDPTVDLRQATPEQIHALYLNALSDKRALLLFDNAVDAAQVKPLIPPISCAMLVTSRRHFVLPGMDMLRLDMLPEADARKLLLTICPRISDHANEIAKQCGQLPLALRIAASALAEYLDLSVDEYKASLADRRTRLAKLKSESDPELDLQATFEFSYDLLANDTKARWRALAVFPAPFDWSAAKSVWGLDEEETRNVLSDLVRFSLLDYEEATQRYSLHDLLTDYANARLSAEERTTAQRRHAQHFVEVATFANQLYLKGGENVLIGLKLFDSEWLHIKVGQAWAAANAESNEEAARLCNEYPNATVYCLGLRLLAADSINWRKVALVAARKLEDKAAVGIHLGNLGYAYDDLGETWKAIKHYEQALAISRETGDRHNESVWLGNLGVAYKKIGHARKAIEYYEQALAISREIGDQHGESDAIGNLGTASAALGETRLAIEYLEQALAIHCKIGDRRAEGTDLNNLGVAYHSLGETRKAIEYHEQALAIRREIGDRLGEGHDLGNLGNAYRALGETHRAIEYHERALVIAREIGDRLGEGHDLGNLGNAYADLGETRHAIEYHEQALTIAREISDRHGEGNSIGNLGLAYALLGDVRGAIEYYEQSLAIAREIGDRRNEAAWLGNLGSAHAKLGETRKAVESYEQALAIFRQIEDKVNEEKVARWLEELRKK